MTKKAVSGVMELRLQGLNERPAQTRLRLRTDKGRYCELGLRFNLEGGEWQY